MAKIKTRQDLRNWILRKMGSPRISVELTEDQINDAIDQAVQYYSEFAYGGTIDGTLPVKVENGKRQYKLDDKIIAVRKVYASPSYQPFLNIPPGYALAIENPTSLSYLNNISTFDVSSIVSTFAQIENIRNLFTLEPKWDFNFNAKIFTLYEDVPNNVILIEISMEYEAPEDDDTPDAIFDNFWIKNRALGYAYITWSGIVGKYDTSLVNGARINYSDIKAEGERLLQETEEQLNDIMDPLGPYVF